MGGGAWSGFDQERGLYRVMINGSSDISPFTLPHMIVQHTLVHVG